MDDCPACGHRAYVTFGPDIRGDRPPAPGCHTPEGCRENGCLGWCDEHKPEAAKP